MARITGSILRANRVLITGAGTSFHAALVAEYQLLKLGVDSHAIVSSEYYKYGSLCDSDTLVIAVSQSGETIDTLVATREFRKKGARVLAVTNVVASTIARESDIVLYTRAGPEIGVAATKTFTTQVLSLNFIVASVAEALGYDVDDIMSEMERIPRVASEVISRTEGIMKEISNYVYKKHSAYFLSRGLGVPLSMEGALKLKEIAYVHAEAYPAGESKHGPIALVEEGYPVIFSFVEPEHNERLVSNVMEMKARGAFVVSLTAGYGKALELSDYVVEVPPLSPPNLVIAYAIPVQLLAYYSSVKRGYDPDKPRNLAKTVTVE